MVKLVKKKLPKDMMCYVGIDPGKNGGLAYLLNGKITAIKMPGTELEIFDWFSNLPVISKTRQVVAVIERVHSMPSQSAQSGFTFGQGYGALLMAMVALKIPFEDIPPQTWMKGLNIPMRKKEENKTQGKMKLLNKAKRVFPDYPLWLVPKTKGLQMAVCDAMLMALFCRRINS